MLGYMPETYTCLSKPLTKIQHKILTTRVKVQTYARQKKALTFNEIEFDTEDWKLSAP